MCTVINIMRTVVTEVVCKQETYTLFQAPGPSSEYRCIMGFASVLMNSHDFALSFFDFETE